MSNLYCILSRTSIIFLVTGNPTYIFATENKQEIISNAAKKVEDHFDIVVPKEELFVP